MLQLGAETSESVRTSGIGDTFSVNKNFEKQKAPLHIPQATSHAYQVE